MVRKNVLFAKASLLAILCTSMFASCASTDDGDFVNPITQYEKIGGHWVINSVTQTDETNQTSMDLTGLFNFDSFGINLDVDNDEKPTTFSVSGTAPVLLPTSGQWKLANSFVNSDGSSAEIILAEKTHLTVTSVPGAKPVLEFKLTRSSNGIPFVSYTYNLTKQAE
jgi:hypothetical protein